MTRASHGARVASSNTTDATTNADGGDAGAPSEGGTSSPIRCTARTDSPLLCEDFEDLTPLAAWNEIVNKGTLAVTSPATRPGRVLRASITGGNGTAEARIDRTLNLAPPLYVRFYAYVDDALSKADYHILFLLEGSELAIVSGRLIVNQFATPRIYEQGADAGDFPANTWTCVEWALLANGTTLTVGGTKQIDFADGGMVDSAFFSAGLVEDLATPGERTILLDDIVVSSAPVGCD